MASVQPTQFAGRYLFVFLIMIPLNSEKLEETIAVGRILTLDPIGLESRHAWKYTGK